MIEEFNDGGDINPCSVKACSFILVAEVYCAWASNKAGKSGLGVRGL